MSSISDMSISIPPSLLEDERCIPLNWCSRSIRRFCGLSPPQLARIQIIATCIFAGYFFSVINSAHFDLSISVSGTLSCLGISILSCLSTELYN